MSERQASSVLAADRKMIRYMSRRPPETEFEERLRDFANERRRFGCRRLFILMRREGKASGINRIYRRKAGVYASERTASGPLASVLPVWWRLGRFPVIRWPASSLI